MNLFDRFMHRSRRTEGRRSVSAILLVIFFALATNPAVSADGESGVESSRGASNLELSQKKILRQLDEVARRLPPPGIILPIQLHSDYDLFQNIRKRLLDTARDWRGIQCLLHLFMTDFDALSSTTRNSVATIVAQGFQSYSPGEWRETPVDELRRFMGIFIQYRDVYREIPPPDKIRYLPFEIRHSLKSSWVSWLDFVKPASPNRCGQSFRQNDLRLLSAACEVLNSIGDPSGLDRVAKLLEFPLPAGKRSVALNYLSKLGDSRAFDLSFPRDDQELCRMKIGSVGIPASTDEDQFFRVVQCRQHDFSHYERFSHFRPDWSRAILRSFVAAGDRRLEAGQPEGEIAEYFGKNHRRLINAGEGALTTAYLELLAHQFENTGAAEQLETVVTLLARRLDWDGTKDLLRWTQRGTTPTAQRPSAKEEAGIGLMLPRRTRLDPVARAAAGGLIRRVLFQTHRAAIREAIDALPDKARAAVAFAVARTLDLEIHIPLADPRVGLEWCGTGRRSEPQWQHWSEMRKRKPPAPWVAFARRHGGELFMLLQDLQDREFKARIFPFLHWPEADQTYLNSVAAGDPSAARIAWQLHIEPASEILKHGLKNTDRDDTRAFLLLMSARNGDQKPYEALKDLVLPSFSNGPGAALSRFKMPLIEEAIRRRDVGLLKELYETVGQRDIPRYFLRGESSPHWGLRLMAARLRADPSGFASFKSFDFSDPANRVGMLRLLAEVGTPDIEALLKKLDSFVPENVNSESERALWLDALQKCASPWCRQELVKWKRWKALLLLDDPRAGNGGGYLLESGRIEEAIEARLDQSITNIVSLPFSGPLTGARSPRYFLYPGVGRSMKILARIWPGLDERRKRVAAELIIRRPEEITDAVYHRLLNDDGGYRLLALRLLGRHPRPALLPDIERLSRTDNIPWCRRIAEEIPACPSTDFDLAARFRCYSDLLK